VSDRKAPVWVIHHLDPALNLSWTPKMRQ
jgi:hypothetical protein